MTTDPLPVRARRVMPGGVSSPVRAFKAVGGEPPFIASGRGATLVDVTGKTYVDLVGSYGPLILGHAHPAVIDAVTEAARAGTSFGAPTVAEVELAELIVSAIPSMDMLRFVSSGTEATMSALRVARAATRRSKVLKFIGCYHGHVDTLLVATGSGAATLGMPDSAGVTSAVASDTVLAPYNSTTAVAESFDRFGADIAAVIVEPIAANMGVVPPVEGFLEALRAACDRNGSLLIFDEVITGFRVGWSGAQGMFNVHPDLTTLGKVIGGGLPIGAYGGRRDLMELVAPLGPVYQAGTLSGNPLSMAAGLATLRTLEREDPYLLLDRRGGELAEAIAGAAKAAGVPLTVQRVGSMLTAFFTETQVRDFETAQRSDTARFASFFHSVLEQGVYWPPAQFEAAMIGVAHTSEDIEAVASAAQVAFRRISDERGT